MVAESGHSLTRSSNQENEQYGGRVSNNTDYRRNKEKPHRDLTANV